MNEKGNYVLAILKTTENYDNLKESLADLTEEMSKLNKVKVRGKSQNIKYFLGEDWKFPACVCGLGELTKSMHAFGANVLITRGISKGYGHFQTVLRGGSSLEEISKFAKSKKFNCKETPLFNFISLDYVIIDTLHLFLGVSDNLTELLIKEIRRKVVCENATCNNGFS